MNDPEILALRESLAAIDDRLADVLKRVDKCEAGKIWDDTRDTFRQLRIAMEAHGPVQTKVSFDDLTRLIDRGVVTMPPGVR